MNARPAIPCVNCRSAKVKCDRKYPCQRCIARKTACTPVLPRSYYHGRDFNSLVLPKPSKLLPTTGSGSEDILISQFTDCTPEHAGLQMMIRHFLSLGVRRRSTMLMAKAFDLASRMKIPMDDIFCDERMQGVMGLMRVPKSLQ